MTLRTRCILACLTGLTLGIAYMAAVEILFY